MTMTRYIQALELHVIWVDETSRGTPSTGYADETVRGHHSVASVWERAMHLAAGHEHEIEAVWFEPEVLAPSWTCPICNTLRYRRGGFS